MMKIVVMGLCKEHWTLVQLWYVVYHGCLLRPYMIVLCVVAVSIRTLMQTSQQNISQHVLQHCADYGSNWN